MSFRESNALRTLKCSVSLCVFMASGIRDFFLRLLGKQRKGSCVVVYYHSIPREQRERFAHQLDTLLRRAKPVSLGDRLTLEPGVRYAGVTFDDGFENFVDVALPELTKRAIPSTVFVIAHALGKAFGPDGQAERVMSAQQVRDLPTHLVTIGSHTLRHPFLPRLSDQDSRFEIMESRNEIERILNRKVLIFSFPYGGFSEKLVEFCREAGYQCVFTTLPGFAFENPDEFVVGRVRVDPDDWPLEFHLKLAGAYHWLPRAFALKRKVLSGRVVRMILPDRRGTDGLFQPSVIQEPISQ
jgi:peptidoglycan/xylan/chitin deacetylase (PgdA/CDA1 family)